MKNDLFFCGTSGWAYPQWKGRFYPPLLKDAKRLAYCAARFGAVEVNSSFYRPPAPAVVAKWQDSVPGDFRFCFKMWRAITHDKRLRDCASEIELFLGALKAAAPGALLLQLPPSLDKDAAPLLGGALGRIRDYGWQVAVEFRHPSWYADETDALLARYGATAVLHDMPGSAHMTPDDKQPFIYYRFHGAGAVYEGDYGDAFLSATAEKIRRLNERSKTVYAFFNNTRGKTGMAPENAMQLQKKVLHEKDSKGQGFFALS